jgi:hypothetical protein
MSLNGINSIWSTIPGLFDALAKSIKDNLSAKKTAENLSELAGQHISKNSVISKSHRSGLPSFQSGEDGKYPRKPKQPRKSRQVPINITRQKVPSRELPDELPMQADFLGLTIEEVGDHQCRYPHGEQVPYLFCGNPVKGESSWCPYHFNIVSAGIPSFKKPGESHESYGTPGGPLPLSRGRMG